MKILYEDDDRRLIARADRCGGWQLVIQLLGEQTRGRRTGHPRERIVLNLEPQFEAGVIDEVHLCSIPEAGTVALLRAALAFAERETLGRPLR